MSSTHTEQVANFEQVRIIELLHAALGADDPSSLLDWLHELKHADGWVGVGEQMAPIRGRAVDVSELCLQALNAAVGYAVQLRSARKGKGTVEPWDRMVILRGDWRRHLADLVASMKSSEINDGPWLRASRCVQDFPGLTTLTGVARWCEKHAVPTRKPARNRLEVHQPRFDASVDVARKAAQSYTNELKGRIADATDAKRRSK